MTDSKVREIFNKAIQICEENGYKPVKLKPVCGYITRHNVYGICGERRYVSTGEVASTEIKINKVFVQNATEEQVLETLLHECLHSACGAKEKHGGKWKEAAKALNKRYGFNIETQSTFRDETGGTVATSKEPKYVLQCKKCGYKYFFNRMCKTVENPSRYLCGCKDCKGQIERIK